MGSIKFIAHHSTTTTTHSCIIDKTRNTTQIGEDSVRKTQPKETLWTVQSGKIAVSQEGAAGWKKKQSRYYSWQRNGAYNQRRRSQSLLGRCCKPSKMHRRILECLVCIHLEFMISQRNTVWTKWLISKKYTVHPKTNTTFVINGTPIKI